MKKLLVGLVSLVALLVMAAPASAAPTLGFSVPNGGDTLPSPPSEVTLIFDEDLKDSFGGLQVFNKAGVPVNTGKSQVQDFAVRTEIGPITEPGEYKVIFKVGLVESQFVFTYAPPTVAPGQTVAPFPSGRNPVPPGQPSIQAPGAVTPPSTPAPTPSGPAPSPSDLDHKGFGVTPPNPAGGPDPVEVQEAAPTSSIGLWVARFVNYVSITIIVGLLLAGIFLLKEEKQQRQAFEMVGEMAFVWALSAVMVFVMALTVAVTMGLPDALQDGLPQRFAGTRFGKAALIQAGLALALAVVATLVGRGAKFGRETSVLLAGAALFTPAFWGHAGSSQSLFVAIGSDWLHLLAVTCWVGGLAVLALFVLRPDSKMDVAGASVRFSKVAGISLVVVLVTGTINALMRINTLDLLFSTEWGRLVLIKLGLFGVIALLGLKNRRRMLPAIAADPQGGRGPFRKMAGIELVVMMLSFAAATTLASTVPSDAEAASRIQSITSTSGANN